ncbi:MAG: hypothetical protein HQ581_09030 [Planctomycetes bacterium]|nr:hypothetical protein [Planctomycetota bacterium]
MSEHSQHPSRFSDAAEADLAEYRSVSGIAVAGLVFGVLSLGAMVDPLAWILPLVGILFCATALVHIAGSDRSLIGRKAALVGLALSVTFGTAGPVELFCSRWLVRREARQFAEAWFEYLRQGEPHKAHQLTLPLADRLPLDDSLWLEYQQGLRLDLKEELKKPLVRSLLHLGDQAQVRFYQTTMQDRTGNRDRLEMVYAVTYPEGEEKKSYLVSVRLERREIEHTTRAGWHIIGADGGIRRPGA